MIRILTYKEHPRGSAILDCYLYLAAYVLPFSSEDVLGSRRLNIDGTVITAKSFLKTHKKARQRKPNYLALLQKHGITHVPNTPKQKLEQDWLLAAKLIWEADRGLYQYLYRVADVSIEPMTLPTVRRENLWTLLTVKMDELPKELEAIGEICGELGKKLLDEVFRYDAFSGNAFALKMLEQMDVNVCPYCNRLYTVTLTGKEGKSRPQFDHYKSKSKYPQFAISLMNLIPSCGLCNQSKRDETEPVLYPYSDEMGTSAVFHTKPEKGLRYLTGCQDTQDEFSVTLDIVDSSLPAELQKRIGRSKDLFHLVQLYNKHKDYILYLFWKNYIFRDEYLQMLCDEFPTVFHSLQDVKTMMYMMDIDPAQWGRRPLAKLTHDIDREINEMAKLF